MLGEGALLTWWVWLGAPSSLNRVEIIRTTTAMVNKIALSESLLEILRCLRLEASLISSVHGLGTVASAGAL